MSIVFVLSLIISYVFQHLLGISAIAFLIAIFILCIKILHAARDHPQDLTSALRNSEKTKTVNTEIPDSFPSDKDNNSSPSPVIPEITELQQSESGNIRRWKENMARRRA